MSEGGPSLKLAALSLVAPAILWPLAFSELLADFWSSLSLATLILLFLALALGRGVQLRTSLKWLLMGPASSLVLYALFYAGRQATRGLEPFTQGIASIYSLKEGAPILLIALLLLFPISPSEEIYWRGYLQRSLSLRWGHKKGLLLATLAYSGIHLFTLNLPLLITAFIAGMVWGTLYWASGSILPSIASHSLFNLLIFVLLPL